MLDISFAELMIIAVVALLVIGPDQLPQVARTIGAFVGRLQRYVAQIKEEVNRETRFEELQSLQKEIKQGTAKVESSIMAKTRAVKDRLDKEKESVLSTSKPKTQKNTSRKKSVINAPTTKKPVA